MAKKQAARHVEPEQVSQEVPNKEAARVIDEDESLTTAESNGTSGVSKTALIREAVQAGYEKPVRGVAYIKDKHGVEIDSKYYSIVKSKLGKSLPKPDAPEPKSAPAQASIRTEQTPAVTGSVPARLFDDLKQLREMKDRYGDDFQKIVDAIG